MADSNGRGGHTRAGMKPSERASAQSQTERSEKAASVIGTRRLARVGMRGVRRQLKKIGEAAPAVLASENPEDIHQMRVAVRRLRTYAQTLEDAPLFRAGRLRRLSRRMQPLATALGDVRDLDILLERVEAFAEAASPPAGALGMLRDELLWRRVKARRRLHHALHSRAVHRVL